VIGIVRPEGTVQFIDVLWWLEKSVAGSLDHGPCLVVVTDGVENGCHGAALRIFGRAVFANPASNDGSGDRSSSFDHAKNNELRPRQRRF
jgi:hypothetical protein